MPDTSLDIPRIVEILTVPAMLTAGIALALLVYFRKADRSSGAPPTEEWWRNFDPNRYAALDRLLSEQELDEIRIFLHHTDAEVEQIRSRRIQIYRQYLVELGQDFEKLLMVGHAMVASGVAGPELREQLLREKVRFSKAMLWRRVEVWTFQIGLGRLSDRSPLEPMRAAALSMRSTRG